MELQEIWEFVDVSFRRNGTDWARGGKHFALATREPLRKIDETAFQLTST